MRVSRVLRSIAALRLEAVAIRDARGAAFSTLAPPALLVLCFAAIGPIPPLGRRPRQALFDGAGMAFETLHPRQLRHHRAKIGERGGRSLNYTGSLDAIVRPQRRGKAGGAAGGQNMIGTREIIAQRSGAQSAQE